MLGQPVFCSQYGNSLSFYGNIEYSVWQPIQQGYGAWPEDVPADSPMLNWQEPEVIDTTIADNIAIIKRLKAELELTEDTLQRASIRAQIEQARNDKVTAFQKAARLAKLIDEEESTFILLN